MEALLSECPTVYMEVLLSECPKVCVEVLLSECPVFFIFMDWRYC